MVSIPLAPRRPLRDKQGGVLAATGISIAATVGIISIALVCGISGSIVSLMFAFQLGTPVMGPAPAAVAVAPAKAPVASRNLRLIGLAMKRYHDQYDSFPPAAGLDKDGKPVHSWRVYLLPFIGREDLHKKYNFDEPWDSPGNSLLHDKMPDLFGSAYDYDRGANAPTFRLITGKGALLNPGKPGSLSDCKDSADQIILAVEVAGFSDNWLKPGELDIDSLTWVNSSVDGEGISSAEDPQGAMVLMADGSTRRINAGTSPEELRRLAVVVDDSGGK